MKTIERKRKKKTKLAPRVQGTYPGSTYTALWCLRRQLAAHDVVKRRTQGEIITDREAADFICASCLGSSCKEGL